jgi:hypothetical protein
VPGKTPTARVIGLENDRHFWRGAICGDGSIFIDKRGVCHIALTGSWWLVQQFLGYASTLFRHEASKPRAHHTSSICFQTSFCGSRAYKLIQLLFSEATVGLPRKMGIAKKIIETCHPKNGSTKPPRVGFPDELLAHNGEVFTVREWSSRIGIDLATLKWRLRAGHSVERALMTPVSPPAIS